MVGAMERPIRPSTSEKWRRRIERWSQSGLTASAYAAQVGLNVHTLRKWKYLLDRQDRQATRLAASQTLQAPACLPLIELRARASSVDERFEVELGDGRRLRVPSSFEPQALRRLLGVLGEVP